MERMFKVGDVVVLKTGGSLMTIINDMLGDDPEKAYYFNGTYRCAWFNDTNEYREIFMQDALMAAPQVPEMRFHFTQFRKSGPEQKVQSPGSRR